MTDKKEKQKTATDLTLLLLAISAWKEQVGNFEEMRAWKGYDFAILDQLVEDGYLVGAQRPSKSKSVVLTEEGVRRAKDIAEAYLGDARLLDE